MSVFVWKKDKSSVPHKPGVYIYKNSSGRVIYVGKAVDLYHRIASYFRGRPDYPKTAALVENIYSCETIVVESELEALILEANLIKRYRPQYNIRLMDDKDYLYIKITKEELPRIITARKSELGDAKDFFGPFPSSRSVRLTLKKIRRLFPWCDSPCPRDGRPCFHYHLGLCPGACFGKIKRAEYLKIISRFRKLMEGKKEELVRELETEMASYSANLQFEQAQAVKRLIDGVTYLTQSNNAANYLENPNFLEAQNRKSLEALKSDLNLRDLPERIECFDISNTLGKEAVGSLVVLSGGDINKRWYRKFKIIVGGKPNDTAMMAEVIRRRLRHPEWPKADLILVDGGKGQVKAAESEVRKAEFDIPIYGLAKRREWLYGPGGELIKLPKASLSLRVLQKIRDEAHRFALTYHRKLRLKLFLPR